MARFSKAASNQDWPQLARFIHERLGLSVSNHYEASHSDPNSEPSSLDATVPHSSFVTGDALARMDELDMRGGLRCVEDDENWCSSFDCEPRGADEIACSGTAGDPFVYRWQRHGGQWYLVDVYQMWPN